MDRQGCAVTGGTCEMVTYDYDNLKVSSRFLVLLGRHELIFKLERNKKIDIPPDMLLALEKRLT